MPVLFCIFYAFGARSIKYQIEYLYDEAHVLIGLPITSLFGTNDYQYYYMGDDAWRESIINITNLIMSEETY